MNRLNNRKARLARTGKDVRAAPEVEAQVSEKQGGPILRSNGSPESPAEQPTTEAPPEPPSEAVPPPPPLEYVSAEGHVLWRELGR